MKKIIAVLVVVVVLLGLAIAGALGYVWYRSNHIFVEDAVYPISSDTLDLRGQDISLEHYETVQANLPHCRIFWDVPFQGQKISNDTTSLTVTELSDEDITRMDYFAALTEVDATGCENYAQIEALMAHRPGVKVSYQIRLGKLTCDPGTTELLLENGDYEYDALLKNLAWLHDLSAIHMRMPELTQEEFAALRETYPDITFTFTVALLGEEYEPDTTELHLASMTSADVEALVRDLPLLPNVTNIYLADENGNSNLSTDDVKKLMEAVPNVVFHYTFDFYGHTLSTADEEVHIQNTKIGEEGVANVRTVLDILTNCKRFVLENCQISNETMAKLRDDYRDRTKIVWRIYFGQGTTMTDAEIIRAVYNLSDANCKDLIYCEDARYVDFGHNGDDGNYLHDCSYVAGMPNLEAIILSSAYVSDLSPFAGCTKLKFLELAFCGLVTDISPLANCTELEMLNISFTGVTDLSPLDKLPLTNLFAQNYSKNRISQEEQDRFQELHPNCLTQYTGDQPYGPGWRYTEDGKDYLEYYQLLRDVFRYEIYPKTPNHVGWYLKDIEFTEKES